eukprot:TRINITY_DN8324_c1_g2_i1.p1 TRINITY_DN8324_c1_g2~~TRINITY_DN8324_c1_g2_i1.p1  ORF type:complete len:199 (-),score=45.64 TRINITY_DN8324_c1_g2_i1:179-775(-)
MQVLPASCTRLLVLHIAFILAATTATRVITTLQASGDSPLQYVEFCLDCPDPHLEGSHVPALRAAHGQRAFNATGDIIYAVPNDGSAELLNPDEVAGHIALLDRGTIPLIEKVLKVQAAGAVGALLVDNGECSEDFMRCGRTGGVPEGGFAWRDQPYDWSKVKIPALLVSEKEGSRVKALMSLRSIYITGHGDQLVPL